MAFWSGNTSLLTIGAATLNCRMTRLSQGSRLTENTHSGTSSTNFHAVVKDHSWSASIPWDDTNLPDTDFGLIEGASHTRLQLRRVRQNRHADEHECGTRRARHGQRRRHHPH